MIYSKKSYLFTNLQLLQAFLLGIALLVIGVIRVSAQSTAPPIIAIGDSITAGSQGPSYLCALKTQLGNTVTFTGPYQLTCPNGTINHAAVDGASTQTIINQQNQWLPSIPSSGDSIVLIELGTNDVYQGTSASTTRANLAQIISSIKNHNPAVQIFLSQIIPSTDNDMSAINQEIASLAQPGVTIVSAGTNFNTQSDLKDNVHPNDSGAQKIAANLAPAIQVTATQMSANTSADNGSMSQNQPPAQTNNNSGTCFSDCLQGGDTPSECRGSCGISLPGSGSSGGGNGGNPDAAMVNLDQLLQSIANLPGTNSARFLKLTTLGGILTGLLPFLYGIAGVGLLLFLIAGGFGYLTSSGDPKKMEAAKGQITAAIIGFIIVIIAFWLTGIVNFVFNLGTTLK